MRSAIFLLKRFDLKVAAFLPFKPSFSYRQFSGSEIEIMKEKFDLVTVATAIPTSLEENLDFEPSAASFFLQHLSYLGNCQTHFKTSSHLRVLNELGISDFEVRRKRQHLVYSASVISKNSDDAQRVLQEISTNGPELFSHHEFDVAFPTVIRLSKEISLESRLCDGIHLEAFRSQPLSRPHYPHTKQIESLTLENVATYLKTISKNVISDHDSSISTKNKYIGGGEVRLPGDQMSTKVMVAFEGAGHNTSQKDSLALRVFAKILGEVRQCTMGQRVKAHSVLSSSLGEKKWVRFAEGWSSSYTDAGLVGILACASPNDASPALPQLLVDIFRNTASSITNQQVQAAKDSILTCYFEYNHCPRVKFDSFLERFDPKIIQDLTLDDVKKAAGKAIKSKPTVAVGGNIHSILKVS